MQGTTETMDTVGIRDLLEAGVHFGHQAKRWNPKMKKYIFAERAGVHIIDLDQTLDLLDKSLNFVRSVAEAGRDVLFVGPKKQAQVTIAEQAIHCGQPYVAERYIGGMLTNFQTIKPRIEYFKDLSRRIEETPEEDKSGKEWFALNREYQKLRRNFAGITEMERLPGAVFVVDPKREELLVKEANRLRIPVVALTDTNCDPDVVDYVIPGNDDAIRSISLISRLISDSIISGLGDEPTEEDRPVPPAVEAAMTSAEPALSEAAEDAGEPTGLANGAAAQTSGSANASEPAANAVEPETPAEETPPSEEPQVEETAATAPAASEAVEEEVESKTGEVVDSEEAARRNPQEPEEEPETDTPEEDSEEREAAQEEEK